MEGGGEQIYNIHFGKEQEGQKDVRAGEEMKVVGVGGGGTWEAHAGSCVYF